ncbi:hypothetical protein DPMN_105759 [Dreissena polymorpha]|uniref:Uncharacterized protein n=1 Tax=Dreissena polymorpha TaxID=45954 RepID=A0A9D4QI32_DREPO|nr:hypothetical protein DPMN_105759 [Dreissena polymorpha]
MKIGPKNVTSRVFTCFHYIYRERQLPRHLVAIFFSQIRTIFELVREINKTNALTKFHDEKLKTAPPTGGHVFQRIGTAFKLNQHIIKTNILTNMTQFPTNRGITGANLLAKFHEDRIRNVASTVFTRKTAPPTGGHVFQRTETTFELNEHIVHEIFELDQGIIGSNLLTKFHEDRTRHVASRLRVFTNQMWTDGRTDDLT